MEEIRVSLPFRPSKKHSKGHFSFWVQENDTWILHTTRTVSQFWETRRLHNNICCLSASTQNQSDKSRLKIKKKKKKKVWKKRTIKLNLLYYYSVVLYVRPFFKQGSQYSICAGSLGLSVLYRCWVNFLSLSHLECTVLRRSYY